jgi:hypothetical protein
MIAISNRHVQAIIDRMVASLTKYKDVSRIKLARKMEEEGAGRKRDYLERLMYCLDDILIAYPDDLLEYQQAFNNIIPAQEIKADVEFKNSVLNALQYEKMRKEFCPEYFYHLGIKSCVYCNAQLAVSVRNHAQDHAETYKARFQVDHFHAQSAYPCLSVSLFNMYPVCSNCNQNKRDLPTPFRLYTDEDDPQSPFEFRLDKIKLAKYYLTRKSEDLDFSFEGGPEADAHNAMFDIKPVYETQKDIIEEMIWKSEVYTGPMKDKLVTSIGNLYHDRTVIDRILIDTFPKPHEIHKRPMSKFRADIAKQLKLI